MKAYDIATAGKPNVPYWHIRLRVNPVVAVHEFIDYVKDTNDTTIRGLVTIMADEIQHNRLDGREYLGSSSTDIGDCIDDSEILLARVLLDDSSHGEPPGYVQRQLENIAWYIHTEEDGTDWIKNWVKAERRYVRKGLEHLEKLKLQQPVVEAKAA